MESISGQDESYVKPRSHEANLHDYNHVFILCIIYEYYRLLKSYDNKRIITQTIRIDSDENKQLYIILFLF